MPTLSMEQKQHHLITSSTLVPKALSQIVHIDEVLTLKNLAKFATEIFLLFEGADGAPAACLINLLMFDMIFVCPKLAIDFRSLSASTGSATFLGTDVAGTDVAGTDDVDCFTFGVN